MKVIENRLIPFNGFKCVNLFGVLFVRKGCTMDATDCNHEAIHTAQMKEMLYVFFYLWYVAEWLVRLARFRDAREAYRNIPFEREAYGNEGIAGYLDVRRHLAWLDYYKIGGKYDE